MGKYFLLEIKYGVKIFIHGPYATENEQTHEAKQIHFFKAGDQDSLFWLDTIDGKSPQVGGFGAKVLNTQ